MFEFSSVLKCKKPYALVFIDGGYFWVRLDGGARVRAVRAALATACFFLAAECLACGGSDVGTIGAVLGRDNDDHALYVRDVPDGLAAAEAGLQPGDEIIMIDGVYVRSLPALELRTRLRGDIGSKVSLTVVRGDRVLHVELRRTPLSGVPLQRKPKEEKITE